MRLAIYDNKLESRFDHGWVQYCHENGIEYVLFGNNDLESILRDAGTFDGIMWNYGHVPVDKYKGKIFLDALEQQGHAVFPNHATRHHYDDKVAQYFLLGEFKENLVQTFVSFDYQSSVEYLEKAQFPLVFKLAVGASSQEVILVESKEKALAIVYRMFGTGIYPYSNELQDIVSGRASRLRDRVLYLDKEKRGDWYQLQKNYVYFQKFLPNNQFDLRIVVVGDRAFGTRRFNLPGDFRASGSNDVDVSCKHLPPEAIQLCFSMSKKFGFQCMAYDLLADEQGEYVVSEISYTFPRDGHSQKCPGYWNSQMGWHNAKTDSSLFQIEDFINQIKARG